MTIAIHTYGLLRAAHGEPQVQGFVDGIEAVYGIAERSEGFIWRFSDYESLSPPPVAPAARTLSIWETIETLKHFVYKTMHGKFLNNRAEWFFQSDKPMMVLWNVSRDARPTMDEAYERLEHLRAKGPGEFAFNWETAERYA